MSRIPASRIPMKSIRLERTEGPADECFYSEFYPLGNCPWYMVDEAEACLEAWAETAPGDGSHHNVNLTVTFEDEKVYRGRIRLQRHHNWEGYNIRSHMYDFYAFWAGIRKPSYLTEEQCLSEATVDQLEGQALRTLAIYDI